MSVRDPKAHKTGWSQSGRLTVGGPQPVSMQADFPDPDVYTVQFAVGPPPSGIYRAIAIVTWTVEGNQITRQVDVGNGVSLSAPSQAVRVRVIDATTGGTPGEQYDVTVSATRGVRPFNPNPPTLSATPGSPPSGPINVVSLAPGASVLYVVPQGVGVVSVGIAAAVPATPGQTPDLLILHTGAASFLKLYKYGDPMSGVGFVAVSPLANEIKLTNLSTTNTLDVSLAWGIDG